jgi:hypothetical protein
MAPAAAVSGLSTTTRLVVSLLLGLVLTLLLTNAGILVPAVLGG